MRRGRFKSTMRDSKFQTETLYTFIHTSCQRGSTFPSIYRTSNWIFRLMVVSVKEDQTTRRVSPFTRFDLLHITTRPFSCLALNSDTILGFSDVSKCGTSNLLLYHLPPCPVHQFQFHLLNSHWTSSREYFREKESWYPRKAVLPLSSVKISY